MTPEEAQELLAASRTKIDEIDRKLVELLNDRTKAVEHIGRAKEAAGLPVYEPKREDDVYRNILNHNGGPMTPDALRRVFERIMDEMRSLQRMRRSAKSSDAKGDR